SPPASPTRPTSPASSSPPSASPPPTTKPSPTPSAEPYLASAQASNGRTVREGSPTLTQPSPSVREREPRGADHKGRAGRGRASQTRIFGGAAHRRHAPSRGSQEWRRRIASQRGLGSAPPPHSPLLARRQLQTESAKQKR